MKCIMTEEAYQNRKGRLSRESRPGCANGEVSCGDRVARLLRMHYGLRQGDEIGGRVKEDLVGELDVFDFRVLVGYMAGVKRLVFFAMFRDRSDESSLPRRWYSKKVWWLNWRLRLGFGIVVEVLAGLSMLPWSWGRRRRRGCKRQKVEVG